MTAAKIAAAAESVEWADRSRVQIGLLSLQYPDATLDDAHAIQSAVVAHRHAEGRHTIGWKIGLTSRAVQQALGITTPDSGVLLDDMAFASGATIPQGRFIQPRIKAELAFILKTPPPAAPAPSSTPSPTMPPMRVSSPARRATPVLTTAGPGPSSPATGWSRKPALVPAS